ncbi:hypothetical protein FRB90_007511, partial [Tulasnella sp. 427]
EIKCNTPQAHEIRDMLYSSPQLERLCLKDVGAPTLDASSGSESVSALPSAINLPILRTFAFRNVSRLISRQVLMHVRASFCNTVMMTGDKNSPIPLDPLVAPTGSELIAPAVMASKNLHIKLDIDGERIVRLHSEPAIAPEWAYWAKDTPGVDLYAALTSRGGISNIVTLDIDWSLHHHHDEEFPTPISILRFCPRLKELYFKEQRGSTIKPMILLLKDKEETLDGNASSQSSWVLPKLEILEFQASIVTDLEETAIEVKSLLEIRLTSASMPADGIPPSDMKVIGLPYALVVRLEDTMGSMFYQWEDIVYTSPMVSAENKTLPIT